MVPGHLGVPSHLGVLGDFGDGAALHSMWELTVVASGCSLSGADVLDILGLPLDPGSPPFD